MTAALVPAGTGGPPRLPPAGPGMRIGLYGGSFNPAHAGHRHVSRLALTRLRLDRVWWLVSPGNPLKDRSALAPLPERLARARAVARDPRIVVTDIEATIGARYTVETLRWLRLHRPALRFVWIMGADSLATFHRWKHYEEIAALVPIAVIDRPGFTLTAPGARAARALAHARTDATAAALLPDLRPPAWVFLHGPRSSLSSTALRSGGRAVDDGAPSRRPH